MRERLSPKITAELCLVSLCKDIAGDGAEGIKARLDRLEEIVGSGKKTTFPSEVGKASIIGSPAGNDSVPDLPDKKLGIQEFPPEKHHEMPAAKQENETVPSGSGEQDSGDLWSNIYNRTKPFLTPDISAFLSTPPKLADEGNVLWIEMDKGLGYTRLNRTDLLEKFSTEASAVLGKTVQVKLREKKAENREQRNLDYFHKFPEVRFVK